MVDSEALGATATQGLIPKEDKLRKSSASLRPASIDRVAAERLEDVIAQVRLDRHSAKGSSEPRPEIFSPPPNPDLLDNFTTRTGGGPWARRFKAMFCCFAPVPEEGHYQSSRDNSMDFNGQRGSQLATMPPALQDAGSESEDSKYVIGPLCEEDKRKKTLVLDLDETLVHSSFKPVDDPDFIVPVDIEGKMVDVYVLKRPGLDHFMEKITPLFETIVFTASLSKYADPLLDLLDAPDMVRWRLFREACCLYEGTYVKDLTRLGRDLATTIIVDNSPLSYIFQPANAVAIEAFMGDKDDQELLGLIPLLEELVDADDVRVTLAEHSRRLKLAGSFGSGESLESLEEAS